MNEDCRCFSPSADRDCHTLILGSMPSRVSLSGNEYYAHPRNAFWAIMASLFAFSREDTPYSRRLGILREHHIALWDVLAVCERHGSADSAIRDEVANDLAAFLRQHPNVSRILLNGSGAASFFNKYQRGNIGSHIRIIQLPSTSPANATMSFAEKLSVWRIVSLPV